MKKMIASLVAVVMGLGASAAALTDITWVGVAGADLATKTNWDPQPTKDLSDSSGNAYRLVFAGDATPVISSADKVYCGEIQVTAGDVVITKTIEKGRFIINNTAHDADYAAQKFVIEVAARASLQIGADGATINVNNSGVNRIFNKTGKGCLTLYGNSHNMCSGMEIDGVLETRSSISLAKDQSDSGYIGEGVIKVKPSSTLKLLGGSVTQTVVVDLAEGAVLDLNACAPTFWAVTGVGTVKNGSLTLLLTHGPYLFAGRFEATTLTLRRHGTGESKKTTEDEFGFILGNAETLAAPGGNVGIEYDSSVTDKTLSDPSKCAIRFAPGIGEFYCATNKVITRPYNGYPIWCADTNGNPVIVHAVLKSHIEHYQYFTGPGSVVAHVVGSNNNKTTLTNDVVSVKGTLGQAEPGTTLILGNGTAAQDFDFTNPAAIDAQAGTITFNNAASVDYAGTLFGSGAFVFNRGATIGSLCLNLGRLTTKGDLTTNGGRCAIEYGADGMHMDAPNLTWTVNGGSIMGDRADNNRYETRYAPLPRGFLPSGSGKGSATLVLNGGDVTIRDNYSYGLKTYQLNGGRLHLAHKQALLPSASADFTRENPHVYVFNGGEVVVSGREGLSDSTKVCDAFPDDERLILEIGDGGASLDDEYIYSGGTYYKPGIDLNKRLTATGAGGLRQRGYMGWRYKYPLPISGTFEGEGSCSCVPTNVTEPGSYFGSGDMILRNHQLVLSGRTADYAFTPHGAGKKLTVGGGSVLALREATKDGHATVAINELAFEPGGALFLLDFNDVGTKSTVTLASAPSTSESGRVRLPVFGVPRAWNVALPLKYDGTDGFNVFASEDYNTTDFTAGGVFYMSNTRTLTSTPAMPLDMLIVGHGGSLTLSDNIQLTVGDGGEGGPSILSIGQAQIVGGANASLSFNNAPGMIVCATSGGDSVVECSSSVQVPIKEADGLSVVSLPDIENNGWRGVRLGTANTYSGVTRVGSAIIQAEHPNCFSTGDVYTIPGKCYGGGVRLTCEGGVWRNNFHLSGQGIRSRKWDKEEFCETGFALGFSRNGEVAGNVSIDRFARLTTSTNPVVGKISGVVSGGMLEIYQTKGAIRLLNDNTYTGGTYVVDSTLELGRGTSAGTGDIWLSRGTLRFVNDQPIVFSNYVYGVGEIEIAGAPVTFVDRSFDKLPIKTLAKGSVIGFTTGYAWGDAADVAASTLKSVVIVDGDTVLDGDVTVDTVWGSGTISGGAVTVTGAVDPNGTLTFAETPVLAGATLTVQTSNGTVEKVVVPGDLDLTGLNLVVEQIGLPVVFAATAFLETSGGKLSGSFATVTLPTERTKNYSVEVGASSATLSYQKPGLMLILR